MEINLDVNYIDMESMPNGTDKAIQYIVSGLLVDGAHHKQWCLGRALQALGLTIADVEQQLPDCGPIEPGIAP